MSINNCRALSSPHTATTTFTQILPENLSRELLVIQNTGSQDLYVHIGPLADASLANSAVLQGTSKDLVNLSPAPVFPVNVATATATTTMVTTEG